MKHRTLSVIAALALLAGCASAEPAPPTAPAADDTATPRTIADFMATHADDLARGIDDPDVPVDWAYVTALIEAWDRIRSQPSRGGFDGYLILTDDERTTIGRRLREALPHKRGEALIPSIGSLVRLDEARGPGFRAAVLSAWPAMGENMHEYLLRGNWDELRCAEFEPVLWEAIRNRDEEPTPWHVAHTPTLALLRMTDLRPDEARQVILTDIRRLKPLFGGMALTALPDETLEEVEDHFRRPKGELLHWSFDMEKHCALAERYGGPVALTTAATLLDRPDRIHDPRLIRVVMTFDRGEGFRRLEKAMRTRSVNAWRRPEVVLQEVFGSNWIGRPDLWGEDAEEFVSGYLADKDEEIRKGAKALLKERRQAAEYEENTDTKW